MGTPNAYPQSPLYSLEINCNESLAAVIIDYFYEYVIFCWNVNIRISVSSRGPESHFNGRLLRSMFDARYLRPIQMYLALCIVNLQPTPSSLTCGVRPRNNVRRTQFITKAKIYNSASLHPPSKIWKVQIRWICVFCIKYK